MDPAKIRLLVQLFKLQPEHLQEIIIRCLFVVLSTKLTNDMLTKNAHGAVFPFYYMIEEACLKVRFTQGLGGKMYNICIFYAQ